MNIKIHSISLLGNRNKNEDEIDIINNLDNNNNSYHNLLYTSVFDGHGGGGISKYLKINLSKYIIHKETEELKPTKDYHKYIFKVFERIQKDLINNNVKANKMGSTALITLLYQKYNKYHLKVINLGDCRVILCNKYNIASQLSKDHKPDKPDELMRIKKLGGIIEYSKDDDPRISGLSVSRSFGDLDCNFISQTPDIYDYKIKYDKFIVLACDGLWDVLSNQDVIDFVVKELNNYKNIKDLKDNNSKSLNNIANKLGEYALLKGSNDNLSIIIIFILNNI
jgi:protein phosphatase 2C family protein 2/3